MSNLQDEAKGGAEMTVFQLFDLTGQTAIVTGGGGGLGSQIARSLAQAGANLVLCSRKTETCENVAREIRQMERDVITLPLDVTDPESVDRLVKDALLHFKKIDILVNCSGVSRHASATEMTLKTWEEVITTNLTGTFLMSQAVGKHMLANGYGKIVNISSVAGQRGYDPERLDSIAYTSSKGGVNTLTKDLAVKWGPHGVYVNAVAPGEFPTNMNQARLSQEFVDRVAKNVPLRKLGGEHDLMGAVLYFASHASDYCTGQILAVDGGSCSK